MNCARRDRVHLLYTEYHIIPPIFSSFVFPSSYIDQQRPFYPIVMPRRTTREKSKNIDGEEEWKDGGRNDRKPSIRPRDQRQSGRIRRSVYDGFHIGPECYFTTGAWGYAFAFFVGGSYLAVESFLCFQASVSFRATQRVQTIASTFLCFSSDPSERITRTDSVCWLLSRGSICLYETRSSAWMLTLPV
jgi:hypothetical protein